MLVNVKCYPLDIQIRAISVTRSFSVLSSSITSGICCVIPSHFSSDRAIVLSAAVISARAPSSSILSCFNSSLAGNQDLSFVINLVDKKQVLKFGAHSLGNSRICFEWCHYDTSDLGFDI